MGLYNEAGTMEQEYSYNAWGKRRTVDTWNANVSIPGDLLLTTRGYTSHEHLDRVNLINMNGRLYDPLTARMLSPDPFVQSPDYTQSYNRYSYCFNNPLKYVDPSGYTALNYIIQWMWDHTPENGWSHWSGETGFVSGNDFNQCPYVTFPSQSGAEGANSVAGNTVKYLSRFEKAINKIARFFAGQTNRFGIAAHYNYLNETVKTNEDDEYNPFAEPEDDYEVKPEDLMKFIDDNFKERLPKNTKIIWEIYEGNKGQTESQNTNNKNAIITVRIPENYLTKPCYLYDCIDHELVHVNDYASGRASIWKSIYGKEKQEAIMEYRAYWRNMTHTRSRDWQLNALYGIRFYYYQSMLPAGWK